MRRLHAAALLAGLSLLACVSGNKIRADADVLKADVERARRSGAQRCAPRELATAEAELDFARGELSQGESGRASQHIREADAAIKKALELSRGCAQRPAAAPEAPRDGGVEAVSPPVVVRIEETDGDGDGVLDRDDPCPSQPEDRDGFQDEDGCPEADNDADGVVDTSDKCPLVAGVAEALGCPEDLTRDTDADGLADTKDRCPSQPEDRDGFLDEDGCPDVDDDADGVVDTSDKCPREAGALQNLGCPVVDRDGDGLRDDGDRCPDEPEDKDGFQEEDGCPDLDNDADGVADAQDRCREQAGPADNGGCPDADRDGDSVVDRVDACPQEAGVSEEKGCPRRYRTVVVKRDRLELKQQIRFRTGSATIIGASSFAVLDDVARALREVQSLKRVRIEGHTDSVGNDAGNLRLSQRRADAVMAQLLRRGVDPGRLEAVGFGETRPLASNATKTGRAENRRTEFNVVER